MTYSDHSITAYVFPQDGAYQGIDDPDSDWQNAAYVGGLAKAQSKNYTPEGVEVTPDYGNNQFSISSGLSYIEDTNNIDFRDWDDAEITRSGTWTSGYLTVMHVKSQSNIPFQTTTGTNYVWLGFDRTSQNNAFIRVADTDTDAPSVGVKIEEIDAGATSSLPKNRVAGYNWNFMKSYEFNGATTATIDVPTHSYDKIWVEFKRVTGTSSGGSNYTMDMVINGNTGGYYQRTTQGSNSGISAAWVTEAPPSSISMMGGVMMMGSWPNSGIWTWHNRTPMAYKYFAYGGGNDTMTVGGQVDTIEFSWEYGDLVGGFNLWGRNFV